MAALDHIADALRGGSNSTEGRGRSIKSPDSVYGMCPVMGGYRSFTGVKEPSGWTTRLCAADLHHRWRSEYIFGGRIEA